MARYGRDYDRDRWGMRGDEAGGGGGSGFYGSGDQFGSHWRGGQGRGGGQWGGGEYGGMGSDAQDQPGWSRGYRGGESGFGSGGGSYDVDYGTSWAGNRGSWGAGGLSRGQGGEYFSGASYGYETGGGYSPGRGNDYSGSYGAGGAGGYAAGGYDYDRGGSGRDFETGGGMGNDWGARDTGRGGASWSGGSGRGGGSQQQDETRRMRASEIMTDNPECVTPESSLADAAAKMRDLNVGIIPVVESEQTRRLKGVVTDRDIAIRAVAEGMDARSTKVSEVMTTEVESCNKNDTVADILRLMEREQVRRVPITDREGRLVGIVAQADVVRDVDSERGEHRVNDAIEQISEPTRSGRGGMMRGSQSRGTGWAGSGNRSGGSGGFGGGMSGRGSTHRSGAEGMGGSTNLGSGSGSSNAGGTGMGGGQGDGGNL